MSTMFVLQVCEWNPVAGHVWHPLAIVFCKAHTSTEHTWRQKRRQLDTVKAHVMEAVIRHSYVGSRASLLLHRFQHFEAAHQGVIN